MLTHNSCALQCEQEPIDNADGLANYNYIHNYVDVASCSCMQKSKRRPLKLTLTAAINEQR